MITVSGVLSNSTVLDLVYLAFIIFRSCPTLPLDLNSLRQGKKVGFVHHCPLAQISVPMGHKYILDKLT